MLKLVRITLETWSLALKYTPLHVASENIPFSTNARLNSMMSVFFAKNQRFLARIVPLHKAIVLFLVFVR